MRQRILSEMDALIGRVHVAGPDQQAGVGKNSLQPAQGASRCDDLPTMAGDNPSPGNGHPYSDEELAPIGGALPGEHDYLDAHDLVDWEQAPFAATAWAIGRPVATKANPDPETIARWLWERDGKVTGELAPTFGVQIHPGRGMMLRRPGLDERVIQRLEF